MSHLKQTLIILFISSCIFFLSACNTESKTSQSVAFFLLKDVTFSAGNENHSLDLSSEKLTRLFGLDSDPLVSAKYYQSLITEVHINKEFSASLPPANLDNFNKFKRKNKVKKFLSNIDIAIQ
ncbi:MAG: hypothetical protein ACWIPI_09520, partial [Polaribacter sp.]